YAAHLGSDAVWGYKINADTGALTRVPGSPFRAGNQPYSLTIDPTGRWVYVANISGNNISAYAIDADTGALTPVPSSPFPTGPNPASVTVDPTGQWAYVANQADISWSTIGGYTIIDYKGGVLEEMLGSPFANPGWPISIAITAGPLSARGGSDAMVVG